MKKPAHARLGGALTVVIALSFADIFRNNAVKNGLLTIELPESEVGSGWFRLSVVRLFALFSTDSTGFLLAGLTTSIQLVEA